MVRISFFFLQGSYTVCKGIWFINSLGLEKFGNIKCIMENSFASRLYFWSHCLCYLHPSVDHSATQTFQSILPLSIPFFSLWSFCNFSFPIKVDFVFIRSILLFIPFFYPICSFHRTVKNKDPSFPPSFHSFCSLHSNIITSLSFHHLPFHPLFIPPFLFLSLILFLSFFFLENACLHGSLPTYHYNHYTRINWNLESGKVLSFDIKNV